MLIVAHVSLHTFPALGGMNMSDTHSVSRLALGSHHWDGMGVAIHNWAFHIYSYRAMKYCILCGHFVSARHGDQQKHMIDEHGGPNYPVSSFLPNIGMPNIGIQHCTL